MPERLTILPDPKLQARQADLREQLNRVAAGMSIGQFADLLDPLTRQCLEHGFAEAGADEGTLWLLDELGENLVPAHNTGPDAARFVGQFKQPLRTGLISMVFASEQPFLENEVGRNGQQSKLLDSLLQVETFAMIAIPFYFLGRCRGVISCVQLRRGEPTGGEASPPTPRGFHRGHLASVQRVGALLTRLIDFQFLSRVAGWSSD